MNHFIRPFFLLFVAFSCSWIQASENELFPFVLSFDAPDNATNIAAKLDAPAGKNGFVRAENGHFVTDKGRIQFWGTNTCFAANFLDHDAADRMAARMARFGINCVRLHHMDSHDIWGGSNAASKMVLDPKQLDKLDFFIAALKKRGIYVNINLHVSRQLDERDGFPKAVDRPQHDKGIDNYYRPLIEANKKYAKDLLQHVNPYTGKAYKDEPAVAMVEINNENSIIQRWYELAIIRDPFLGELRKEWNTWLKAKYKDDEALKKAWRCRNEPLGAEMIKNADIPTGFLAKGSGWYVQTDSQSDVELTNPDGVLCMKIRKKGKVSWIPQLIVSGFGVEKERLYTLQVKAKADRGATVTCGVRMEHDPWGGLGFDGRMELSTDWQTFEFVFTATADDDKARFAVSSLEEGTTYQIDSISLKPGGKIGLPLEQTYRSELLDNGEFRRGYMPGRGGVWNWERDPKTDASLTNPRDSLRMEVRKRGEKSWHPQLSGSGFGVKKGEKYTLTLKAKADRDAPVDVGLRMAHEPWGALGFDDRAELSTGRRTFQWTLTPSADDDNARIVIGGFREGTVYEIDSVSLKPGEAKAEVESSLARGTVPVFWKKDLTKYAPEAVDDFCDFLMDLEARYWDEMYRYLKDDLKVRQPVSGTQLNYGSTHAQARMDYCDIHAYWNHPNFPGRPWDGKNWTVSNRALVNSADKSILTSLATKRVAGLPYTVSEYNHPQPNRFAAEGLPLIAAFGAMQDWDGIFPFAYSHSSDPEPKRVTGFFDTAGNTVQMAHMIACHTLFCDGYNKGADKSMLVAPMSLEKEREIFRRVRGPYAFGFSGLGLDPRWALLRSTGVDVFGKTDKMPVLPEIAKDEAKFAWEKSATEYCRYDNTQEGRGFASLCNAGGALFTGFVDEGKAYPFGTGTATFGKTNLGWATVTLAPVDAAKKRFLLVATGEMLNTDMMIEQLDGEKITVGNRWGKEPVRCEGIPATIAWKEAADVDLKCWALDESGDRKREVPVRKTGKGVELELKPACKTIWYEIEAVATR